VHAERELIDKGLLATEIIDANFGIGDTTAEARLGVRLVFAVTVATSRTTTHVFLSDEELEREMVRK